MERIDGFTLIELVLTISLLGIVVVVSGVLMGRGIDAYKLVSNRTQGTHTARTAMVRMQKEIEGLRDVTTSQPQTISFQDSQFSPVTFQLDGTTLLRNDVTLAEGVSALQFTYYRDNGNETQSAPQVRRIHIDLSVQADPESGVLSLRTDVFPRNFIYENFQ